jgi:hypothetical protein
MWSTELPTPLQSGGKGQQDTMFDASKSSTFKKAAGSTWTISYGDGSTASGDVGTGHGPVYGGIQSRGSNPFDILGDMFVKIVYAASFSTPCLFV